MARRKPETRVEDFVRVPLRLPRDLLRAIEVAAGDDGRSRDAWIRRTLERAVKIVRAPGKKR